jgi:hypothetical protein
MLRGAIHIHSRYSDGEFSLPELREIYLSAGFRFAGMTDHAEAFDSEKLEAYVAECRSLSDDRFCFVPGLEYECQNRLHILGYGMTVLASTRDPQAVIRKIEELGGISVIAHPADAAFEWVESFELLPQGIEVWNSKYDGRYAPRPATFLLLHRLQQRKPSLRAFYGQDLHWKKQFRGLANVVCCQGVSQEEILAALARGEYRGVKDHLELPADGKVPQSLLEHFGSVHEHSDRFRRWAKKAKQVTDRLGVNVPTTLKAQLRRFF